MPSAPARPPTLSQSPPPLLPVNLVDSRREERLSSPPEILPATAAAAGEEGPGGKPRKAPLRRSPSPKVLSLRLNLVLKKSSQSVSVATAGGGAGGRGSAQPDCRRRGGWLDGMEGRQVHDVGWGRAQGLRARRRVFALRRSMTLCALLSAHPFSASPRSLSTTPLTHVSVLQNHAAGGRGGAQRALDHDDQVQPVGQRLKRAAGETDGGEREVSFRLRERGADGEDRKASLILSSGSPRRLMQHHS